MLLVYHRREVTYNRVMDKELQKYIKEAEAQVKGYKAHDPIKRSEVQSFYELHIDRVRDFQHERLVHLIVTLFFGCLLLLSVAGGLYALTLMSDPVGPMMNILTWALCALLLVTEIFYIRHYYILENGVQRLYKSTQELEKLIENN